MNRKFILASTVLALFSYIIPITSIRSHPYSAGIEIHHGSNGRTTQGNQSYGEPCDRVKNECESIWSYSHGRRVRIDLICFESKCECPHPTKFWADTTTKTCRRKAGVTECDIQSDDSCVPNAICVMDEIIEIGDSLGFTTKCSCRSGCSVTGNGFCRCDQRSNIFI